nr:LacI family DNA-binding transcriptional regulator [uncultured Cellulosilyticum sp.]
MNITQIAKLAGVSSATVSRFLNDGYVSAENREKIQKIIDETGYIPSAHAKTLRTNKTNVIGVILPKISSAAVSSIVEGISTQLGKTGYNVLLGNTDLNIEKEIEYLGLFKNKQVDGIIFVATILTEKHYEVLKTIKVPIVIVGQEVEGYNCIYHDDFGAMYALTNAFIEKGHHKLAYIGVTTADKAAGESRRLGYEAALKAHQLPIDEALIQEGAFSMTSGFEKMKVLHESHKEIDGVLCATDQIAIGAMEYMKESWQERLDTMSISGIGNTQSSKVVTPKLTSVKYYYEQSGEEAAKMIVAAQEDAAEPIQKIKLGFELKVRESLR